MQKKNSLLRAGYHKEHEEKTLKTIEERKKVLADWQRLKLRKVPDKEIEVTLNISRAQYYRVKKSYKKKGDLGLIKKSTRPHNLRPSKIPQALKERVLKLRQQYLSYGKFKIFHLLKKDFNTSESSVGRILSEFLDKGTIQQSPAYRPKRRARVFKGHAQKWTYGMPKELPGTLVQIDHMTTPSGAKEFHAVDPVTKYMVACVYKNATSLCADDFLHHVIKEMPFDIRSIQVDGGSEFMAEFEESCRVLKIPLYVLPPKRPQYNGGVERSNGIIKDEFYACFDVPLNLREHNALLRDFVSHYNSIRPHGSLDGQPPLGYYYHRYENTSF